MNSSLGLYIAILILLASTVTILSGLAFMYRRKSGLFKQSKIKETDTNKSTERTVLQVKYNWDEDQESDLQEGS